MHWAAAGGGRGRGAKSGWFQPGKGGSDPTRTYTTKNSMITKKTKNTTTRRTTMRTIMTIMTIFFDVTTNLVVGFIPGERGW